MVSCHVNKLIEGLQLYTIGEIFKRKVRKKNKIKRILLLIAFTNSMELFYGYFHF